MKYSKLIARTFLAVLTLAALLLAACDSSGNPAADGDADTPAEQQEQPQELPFEPAGPTAAPDPFEPGPFAVGCKTYTFTNNDHVYRATDKDPGKARTLITEVWYPARQEYKNGPFHTYEIGEEAPDYMPMKQAVIDAHLAGIPSKAVRDAEMDRDHGPYPVIFFSHGANGIRWQSTFYTDHLASHGYIVVAADHEHNTVWDLIMDGYNTAEVVKSAPERLEDMPFLLDRMTEFNNDAAHFFASSMNLDKVGITGHSFGGFTSYTVPCRDTRFKAAVAHSPVMGLSLVFGCVMEEYSVPLMVMGGTTDKTVPYHDQYCEYRMTKGQPKWLYEVEDGGHFTFSNICDLDLLSLNDVVDFSNAEDALEDGCADFNVPYQDAHQTIDFYATAFFNNYLRGSSASLDYLEDRDDAPFDSVNFYVGDDLPDWPDGGCED